MKKQPKPARYSCSILHQICQYIPRGLIPGIARSVGVDTRGFSETSHVLSLMFGHLAGSVGLNDICDTLKANGRQFRRIRGAKAPARNTFSHANRNRDPAIAENLFWAVFRHLRSVSPAFFRDTRHAGPLARFKRFIQAIDSTVIQLVLSSIDWAKYRRKKAAAKLHLLLNLGNRLPTFARVDEAAPHDSTRAEELYAHLKADDVLLGDKAYLDFAALHRLTERGIWFVLRAKKNMVFLAVKECFAPKGRIVSDRLVRLQFGTAKKYPLLLRMVVAIVEVNGCEREMSFITNQMTWAASSIAGLYKGRWGIETFFKELKQTLQLRDFVGYNENAVKWQIWTGLLVHLLLRYVQFLREWQLSFSRLSGILRGSLWQKSSLPDLLALYGTARRGTGPPLIAQQLFLRGFG